MRDFCAQVRAMQDERDGPFYWATGGPNEHTLVADLMRERGIRRLVTYQARISKRARSQDVADAWNAGRVGWPPRLDAAMRAAIDEITRFTGDDRDHDDCVDALASAFKPVKERLAGLSLSFAVKPQPAQKQREENPFWSSRAYTASLMRRGASRGERSAGRDML